jgi:hypothetical protein
MQCETLTGAGTALDFDYSDSEIGESSRTGVVDRTVERVFDPKLAKFYTSSIISFRS